MVTSYRRSNLEILTVTSVMAEVLRGVTIVSTMTEIRETLLAIIEP
ncbi:hypothetical protein [Streptococcus jiangjianxini]